MHNTATRSSLLRLLRLSQPISQLILPGCTACHNVALSAASAAAAQ
jgi:hypothetical protein